jgi:hypothetical protein
MRSFFLTDIFHQFLGTFPKLLKLLASSYPFVRMEQLDLHYTDFDEISYLSFSSKICREN